MLFSCGKRGQLYNILQHSPGKKGIWRTLWRSPAAATGIVIISGAFLTAVFAYDLAPDDTPDADLQTVEIQSMPAGYKQLFFTLPLDGQTKKNVANDFFTGRPATDKFIPITGYNISGHTITLHKYVDEDTATAESYNIDSLTRNGQNIIHRVVTKKYFLGTDAFGRDIFSRLIIGTRVSMGVGIIAVLISLTIGIFLGALAGWYGGRTDALVMWLVNVTWSMPTLLLVFAVTLLIGKGFWEIFIAVGLTLWVNAARLVRGRVMAVKELEYVQAARALGLRDRRIIWRHILPNISGPIFVIAAANFATAIIIEAGLSFLGIGVQPPQPSWGLMMRENYNLIITHHPLPALIPGFAIMLLVLAFNLTGTGLRDALDK